MGVTLDGLPCVDPATLIEHCEEQGISTNKFYGKANSFMVPVGAPYGRGWVLMLRQHIDQLNIEGFHVLVFDDDSGFGDSGVIEDAGDDGGDEEDEDVSDDEGDEEDAATSSVGSATGRIEFQSLIFIRAEAITPGADGDPNCCFVVELADQRYLLHNQYYSYPINKQYNIHVPSGGDPSYYAFSCLDHDLDTPHTWQTMLDDVWETFGDGIKTAYEAGEERFFGDSPALPHTPDGTPENFAFLGVSAWLAYNSIMRRIGCVVVPTDMTFYDWRIDQSNHSSAESAALYDKAEAAYKNRRVYDSTPIESWIGKTPASVDIALHHIDGDYGNACDTRVTHQDGTYNLSQWRQNCVVGINDDEGLGLGLQSQTPGFDISGWDYSSPSTKGLLWDDMSHVWSKLPDGGVTVERVDEMEARAVDRAEDYYRAVSSSSMLHIVYSGVINDKGFYPGTYISGYSVYDRGDGYMTEIVNMAGPTTVSASGEWVEDWESVNQILSPPSIGKASLPAYPNVTQWVLIVAGTSSFNPHLYDAKIVSLLSNGSYRELDSVWVSSVGSHSLTVDHIYDARVSGYASGYIDEETGYESRAHYAVLGGFVIGGECSGDDIVLETW